MYSGVADNPPIPTNGEFKNIYKYVIFFLLLNNVHSSVCTNINYLYTTWVWNLSYFITTMKYYTIVLDHNNPNHKAVKYVLLILGFTNSHNPMQFSDKIVIKEKYFKNINII